MNSTVLGALIGVGLLVVVIVLSWMSGRGEGMAGLSIFTPKLKALIFTRAGSLIFSKAHEVASVVWVVNPASVWMADERAVTYLRTVRMFGFMQRTFRPRITKTLTLAKGDGFPLTLDATAANGYRLSYGGKGQREEMVDEADRITAAEARRQAEREDEKGGLTMISWSLFIGMVATVGVFIWLMLRARQLGVI